MKQTLTLIMLGLLMSSPAWSQVRLKDIASLEGVRGNQLTGLGIIVGLNGTGDKDQTRFTTQALANALSKSGIGVSAGNIKVKNVAVVSVQAELPPFAKPGSKIDVLISSLGDATSLQGGNLLLTDLKGIDGQIYALAQGPVSIGGFSAGGGGSQTVKNHPTSGILVNGAIIEREVPLVLAADNHLRFSLHQQDFTTMNRAVLAVNALLGDQTARSLNARVLQVKVPEALQGDVVALVSRLENLTITPDAVAKVVVNERTGTIIIGENVKVNRVAIAHGSLTIRIQTSNVAVPSGATVGGADTVIETNIATEIEESDASVFVANEGISLGSIAQTLNALKVAPRDIIAILQAMKEAGALHAELKLI